MAFFWDKARVGHFKNDLVFFEAEKKRVIFLKKIWSWYQVIYEKLPHLLFTVCFKVCLKIKTNNFNWLFYLNIFNYTITFD